jgi:hypothetical protein
MSFFKRLFLSAALVCGIIAVMAPSTSSAADDTTGVYRHVVLFKFKDTATPEQIKTVEANFRALPTKINTITGYEWGTNVSPENKNEGYTHCFFLTFKDKAGVDFYLPHPAHKEFGAGLKGLIDKVLVIDYVSAK